MRSPRDGTAIARLVSVAVKGVALREYGERSARTRTDSDRAASDALRSATPYVNDAPREP